MILRGLGWLIRRVGLRTLLILGLLLLTLESMAWTLVDIIRGLNLNSLLLLVPGAVGLSWILAKARPVPGWLAGLLLVVIGLEAIIFRLVRLEQNLFAVGEALLRLAWQIYRWPTAGPLQFEPLGLALAEIATVLNTLLARLLDWLGALASGTPVFDPVAVTLVWSLAVWLVSAWAGWGIRRLERPLVAVAPAGALLITTLAYTSSQIATLSTFLATTLLLIGFAGHHSRERRWKVNRIDFSPDLDSEVAFTVVPITMILVALALVLPSISLWEIPRFFQQTFGEPSTQAEPVMGSLGLEMMPAQPIPLQDLRTPGLPRGHLLGSGPELSEQIALLINTGQPAIGPAEVTLFPAPPNYYWRSLTYDIYTGRGWRTSETEAYDYEAGENIHSTTWPGRRLLRQRVENVGRTGNLVHAAGEIVTSDHDYTINWRGPENPFAITIAASTYRVDSLVATPVTETELRQAGIVYPEWVEEQGYLNLPEQLPERVLNLARDLTATAPTPYDRAKAIETYLRTFTYSLELPEPPVTRDMVDYFLFDLQQGYCDYYASAMVVLARAAGLPARLAVGYASGNYDALSAQYVVTEADAHSWPEIYFPQYGWINFEPTAARPVPDRSDEVAPAGEAEAAAGPLEPLGPLPSPLQGLGGLLAWSSLGLLLLAGAAWFMIDRWRLRRLAPVATVALVYKRLGEHGQRLAVPAWRGDTPYEFATSLTGRLEGLAQGRWAKLLSPASPEVRSLTDLYVRTIYSPRYPDPDEQQQVIRLWQRLRSRLWLAWLVILSRRMRQFFGGKK